MNKLEKLIGITMLFFAIGFNLWLYRLEPTAKVDPNDNAFQYGLVDRTNQIWDFADKKCSWNLVCRLAYLTDHWVPNWAEGYNLPYYYSHLPQIIIVGSYRLFDAIIRLFHYSFIPLFAYYHLVIYLLLSLFPLSVFLALRVIGLPWLAAGLGSLLATQISTNGLYGLDSASFLWRGYGLSSQLFAMIFLPQAMAYSWKYFMQNSKHEARNPKQYLNANIQNSKQFKTLKFGISNLFRIYNFEFRISPQFWLAVFFLFATTAGHLGIGIIATLSLLPLALAKPITLALNQQKPEEIINSLKENIIKLILLSLVTIFFLSYWIVPVLLNDNYHNISFWDPVWKFNSYGAKEVIIRLLNGDLFDFGRFPVFTLLVTIGFLVSLATDAGRRAFLESPSTSLGVNARRLALSPPKGASIKGAPIKTSRTYFPFALLFVFWLLLYFGRTTWGGLIDFIPGMKDFHLSRFIVGLHLAGLFLAPMGITRLVDKLLAALRWIVSKYQGINVSGINYSFIRLFVYLLLCLLLLIPIYQQTIKYNDLNNRLILQANANFDKVKPNVDELFSILRGLPPGRVFAGRGGSWGKNFRVAETPLYMHLSTYGVPTVLWLPETWSPNSDVEQFMSENQQKDYDLFNISYVVAPPDQPAETFWQLIKENPLWKLYKVQTHGYIVPAVRPAIVATDKRSYVNVVHEFIQSDFPAHGLYPELTFAKDYPKKFGPANFRMLDEVTYEVPDGSIHNLFKEPPLYLPPDDETAKQCNNMTIQQQTNEADMIFKAQVTKNDNADCLVILKESDHPNWRATIDGKPTEHFTVFPFYVAVLVSRAGNHEITFAYEPSRFKVTLLLVELAALLALAASWRFKLREKLRY